MQDKPWRTARVINPLILFGLAVALISSAFAQSGNQPPLVAVTEPNSDTIWPTNFTLRISAAASDPDGHVTRVEFYARDNSTRPGTTNKLAETSVAPYSVVLPLPRSTTALFAVARDNSGLMTTSAPVQVRFYASSEGGLGFSPFDPQNAITGYFERELTFQNQSTFVLEGARLTLFDVPAQLKMVNATALSTSAAGTNAFFDYPSVLRPGERMTFLLEIGWANPSGFLDTRFQVAPIPAEPPTTVSGQPVPIARIAAREGGIFLIEFASAIGASYAVQYSNDCTHWETSRPFLTGTGSALIWSDTGPPKTLKPSAEQKHRFYRLIRLN